MYMNAAVERSIGNLSGFVAPQLLASERYVELDGSLAKIFPLGRVQLGYSKVSCISEYD